MNENPRSRRRFLEVTGALGVAALGGSITTIAATNDSGTSEHGGLPDPEPIDIDRIAADPTEIPDPVDWNEPRHHEIQMEATERVAEIEPGVTFTYMTFEDQVPGPMVRVRRGDTVSFALTNPDGAGDPHSMDFHAVYGPGGGAADTTVEPGETAEIEFRAEFPGVHIYHCGVPSMDHHISAGMFGAILVEPEAGLPAVDRELYFGQHELYTTGERGEEGHHGVDFDAMSVADPTYVALNGEPYAFTDGGYGPITAQQDERIRVYYANGGPNLTSAWHPIGNVWSDLYRDGDFRSEPAQYIETTSVAPGTVTAAELETLVPGPIKLVDHSLSRGAGTGALAVVDVDGDAESDIYDGNP